MRGPLRFWENHMIKIHFSTETELVEEKTEVATPASMR